MIWHVLGYTTFAADAIGGVAVAVYLTKLGRRPWTWQRKVRSPKVVAEPYYRDDASVGVV